VNTSVQMQHSVISSSSLPTDNRRAILLPAVRCCPRWEISTSWRCWEFLPKTKAETMWQLLAMLFQIKNSKITSNKLINHTLMKQQTPHPYRSMWNTVNENKTKRKVWTYRNKSTKIRLSPPRRLSRYPNGRRLDNRRLLAYGAYGR